MCDTLLKQARKSFAILSLQVSRDMKSIAAGPLRPQLNKSEVPLVDLPGQYEYDPLLSARLVFSSVLQNDCRPSVAASTHGSDTCSVEHQHSRNQTCGNETPPICIKYGPHLCRHIVAQVLGSGVVGTLPLDRNLIYKFRSGPDKPNQRKVGS